MSRSQDQFDGAVHPLHLRLLGSARVQVPEGVCVLKGEESHRRGFRAVRVHGIGAW
jgi:hypothetical protein